MRHDIMLCYPFDLDRLSGPSRKAWNYWPVIVQPKIDGERCRALFNNDGTVSLISSQGNEIVSVPHINRALSTIDHFPGLELDGELYKPLSTFEKIHSIVSRKSSATLHDEHESIQYHVFDVISEGLQMTRIAMLDRLSEEFDHKTIMQVPYYRCHNVDRIEEVLKDFLNNDFEGIVVRHPEAHYERKRSTNIMKFKPSKEDCYRIIGFQQEVSKHGELKGTLGAFIVTDPEGNEFQVGSGFTAAQRDLYWRTRYNLIGKIARVRYQNLTERGVPRFGIFVEVM